VTAATIARRRKAVPSFRCHKASNQSFVELNGKRIYLGRYDLPETREKYHRTIAEWLAASRKPAAAPGGIAIVELVDRYWEYAITYYRRPDGSRSPEAGCIHEACKPLKELYASAAATSFGPLALKAVRQKMIDRGWCRMSINRMIGRVKRLFKWAVAQELVPGSVYHALQCVPGLSRGRSEAKESDPVRQEQGQEVVNRRPAGLLRLNILSKDSSELPP
jgi:hypothetical protein